VASQAGDPASLLSRYRTLTRARRASPALRDGSLRMLTAPVGASPVLAFVREAGDERVLVAHNLSDAAAEAGPWPVEAAQAEAILADPGAAAACAPACRASLPPRATGIWRLR
jgi:alpha-glucosidase